MHRDERLRKQQLAWDDASSLEVLVELARDSDPYVRAAVAQNAPEALLRQLASDPRAEVRAAVAAREDAPRDLQLQLVHDRSTAVRWWLAACSAQRPVLKALIRDPDEFNADTARENLRSRGALGWLSTLPERALTAVIFRRLLRIDQGKAES